MTLSRLHILISKTSNGKMDYVQIISEDQVSINVVFVAEAITVEDKRDKP